MDNRLRDIFEPNSDYNKEMKEKLEISKAIFLLFGVGIFSFFIGYILSELVNAVYFH